MSTLPAPFDLNLDEDHGLLETMHRPVLESSQQQALIDVLSYAMVARSRLCESLERDEPATSRDARLLARAVDILLHAQRIINTHDPETL